MQVTDKDLEQHRQRFQKCRKALHALGNESRQELCMILMMNSNGLRVADLVQEANLSRSVVSHHMKVLIEAGIVKTRKEGTCSYRPADSIFTKCEKYFKEPSGSKRRRMI